MRMGKAKKGKENLMKYLIVVDMQNDFISGSLGSKSAEAVVPNVVEKVKNFNGKVEWYSINRVDKHPKI